MLEKLAMHEVEDVSDLSSLADKCAKAAKGRGYHTCVAQQADINTPNP
jgi:hypothetical protein